MFEEPTAIQEPRNTNTPRNKGELPNYEKNFGHVAEDIIRDFVGKKAGLIVENIEKGTDEEDIKKKVDFWIKFHEIEAPIGIQYTCSDNEDLVQDKMDYLRSINNTVKKDARPDAEINWSGNTDVVLVRGNKSKMAHIWKESQEKNVSPSELVGDEFIRGFFSQIFTELEIVNPIKKEILYKAFLKAAKEAKK